MIGLVDFNSMVNEIKPWSDRTKFFISCGLLSIIPIGCLIWYLAQQPIIDEEMVKLKQRIDLENCGQLQERLIAYEKEIEFDFVSEAKDYIKQRQLELGCKHYSRAKAAFEALQ